MHQSCLLIDVGMNPDRPRPGRQWLRNRYRVHQRLCMAFPSASKTSDDPDFIRPFNPDELDRKQVHVARGADAGFLFRIDPQFRGRAVILVQSAVKPDWDYAFHNASHLLAAPPESQLADPQFEKGQRLRFRLVANPTRKIDTKSGPDGHRRNGRRVPVKTENLIEWLTRRAEPAGFSLETDSTNIQPGYIYVNGIRNGNRQRLRSVRYDGILKITDVARFQRTLVQGIGPGKAFGFGLLSVAASWSKRTTDGAT